MAHVTRILFSLRAGLIGGTGKVAVGKTLNEGLDRFQKLLGTVRESKKARRSWFFMVYKLPSGWNAALPYTWSVAEGSYLQNIGRRRYLS